MRKRNPSKFELRHAEESMDRIELLIKRKDVGELRALFRWGANLSEPAAAGGDIGYRRAPGHSNPTADQAGDARRRSIYLAVREAEASLEHAYGVLNKVLGGRMTIPRDKGDSGSWTTRDEMEVLREMQIKRAEQGGGYGAT